MLMLVAGRSPRAADPRRRCVRGFVAALTASGALLAGERLSAADEPPARPRAEAHAHNDYEHARPLHDALEHGFTSVEADVFLVDGRLLVAHDLRDVAPERTLDRLYLEPLRERVRARGGSVHGDGRPFTLLVDVKRDGAAAYAELSRRLHEYADIVSSTRDGKFVPRAITVVVSGDRAVAEILASNPRLVGIDGRLGDLDADRPAEVMPLISDNWRAHFRFRGGDGWSADEDARLRDIVARAHRHGRRVRFWATPESEDVWAVLEAAGVDLIGTDDLGRLRRFLDR